MENLYSTIFIVDISQNPDESETVTSRIQQLIEDHGGIIRKINRWGKRRLAYPIEKKSHGFYVEIEFSANSRLNIPGILEAEFRINDRLLRYMSYVVDKMELIQREKNAGKLKKAQAEELSQKTDKPAASEEPSRESIKKLQEKEGEVVSDKPSEVVTEEIPEESRKELDIEPEPEESGNNGEEVQDSTEEKE